MDLKKFQSYLKLNKIISISYIPYYLKWVELFLQFCQSERSDYHRSEICDKFLNNMGRSYEQWQVDQARHAILLYIYCNRGDLKGKIPDDVLSKREWTLVSESMKRLMRLKHLSYRTEQTYLHWLRDFYVFVKPLPPDVLGQAHLKNYLTYLAVDRHVSKSTQNLAFNALLFFYRHVIEKDVGALADVVRSRRGRQLPTVLTMADVNLLLDALDGRRRLMAQIIYGGGLRLRECVRLRIKDIDFEKTP